MNWETAPIHPIALSPDGQTLAVCNLPDARLELFDATGEQLAAAGSIPAGLDPVTVRFRDAKEVWVVNHISDSISVIDLSLRRLIATINTLDSPQDVVFAGSPPRAFVTCSSPNVVQVFDPSTRQQEKVLEIDGNRPRALAVSPDSKKVYVAIFESGNASTILASRLTQLERFPQASVVDFPSGPHGGLNPPPSHQAGFPGHPHEPGISNRPPAVGLIVKKSSQGQWLDDQGKDWTSFVSGTNAVFSGRVPGWDMPDHDIAVVDTTTWQVSYLAGLMNICMDLAVNPADGRLAVVGTEALNQIRFEPALKGIFARVRLALIDPQIPTVTIRDLNPHLDYSRRNIALAERRQSMGDPRTLVWNQRGDRAYVAGMGSNNLLTLDAEGNRIGEALPVGAGPVGLALDEARQRAYVLNRFDASISVVDLAAGRVRQTVGFFDPTPLSVRRGRPHLYNTHATSGLGQVACGTCHVDGQLDRLAWDLGDPHGPVKRITPAHINFANFPPAVTNHFHPMKGPMVTQTLQDIIGHEPLHWRGDRDGLEQFNPTFVDLQGADGPITDREMQDFKNFLATIHFPPNPFRTLSNSLPVNLPLPGHFTLGRGARDRGRPLRHGNAERGLTQFRDTGAKGCIACHTLPSGLGPDMRFMNGTWRSVPPGPNGERHVALIALNRSHELPFKIAPLRGLADKVGFALDQTTSRTGFGFFHDGGTDTLTRLLQDGFGFADDQETADMIAFLLAFTGSDLPGGSFSDRDRAPGLPSGDTHAAVGKQLTLTSPESPALLDRFMEIAAARGSRVDLIARGHEKGAARGWFFTRDGSRFQSDRQGEPISLQGLLALATAEHPLTFTVVPRGSGARLGIDRDEDGFFDLTEVERKSDPNNALSIPGNEAPRFGPFQNRSVIRGLTLQFTITANDPNAGQKVQFQLDAPNARGAGVDLHSGLFTWTPDQQTSPGERWIKIIARDDGAPSLSNAAHFVIDVIEPSIAVSPEPAGLDSLELRWRSISGQRYQVQWTGHLENSDWQNDGPVITATERLTRHPISADLSKGRKFYRVQYLP